MAALLLVVSEFTTLYTVHLAPGGLSIDAVTTHAHDFYALIPIALLVAVLALGAGLLGSRLALLGLAVLAVATLCIALIGDLPDAQTTGTVIYAGPLPERDRLAQYRFLPGDARSDPARGGGWLRAVAGRTPATRVRILTTGFWLDTHAVGGGYIYGDEGRSRRSPRSRAVGHPRA